MSIDPTALAPDITAYRGGDQNAAERICSQISPMVKVGAARLLGDDDQDLDDVVQESLLAGLHYLRRDEAFQGDLVRLAVTIARNRCRDILRMRLRRPQVAVDSLESWLSDEGRSALDDLAESQLHAILQEALDKLSTTCRRLLRALYLDDTPTEDVRLWLGLSTVQGVYHRRSVCLMEAKKLVQRRLVFGSRSKGKQEVQRESPHGDQGKEKR